MKEIDLSNRTEVLEYLIKLQDEIGVFHDETVWEDYYNLVLSEPNHGDLTLQLLADRHKAWFVAMTNSNISVWFRVNALANCNPEMWASVVHELATTISEKWTLNKIEIN